MEEFKVSYDYSLIEEEAIEQDLEYGNGDTSLIDESRRLTVYNGEAINNGYSE